MGLIRKTLAVGTVGVVRPSSKKQRSQKALIKEAKSANALAAQQLQHQVRADAVARAQADQAIAFAQAQTAYLQAQAAQSIQATPPTTAAIGGVAPGWYNDPSGAPNLRYFDGTTWTAATATFSPESNELPN